MVIRFKNRLNLVPTTVSRNSAQDFPAKKDFDSGLLVKERPRFSVIEVDFSTSFFMAQF